MSVTNGNLIGWKGFGMMGIHGGDIYRNFVTLDFSVNVNPLGIPEKAKEALHQAVDLCGRYPDMKAENLKKAVGEMLAIPEEYLLFGNGASELFMAVAHGIKAKKIILPVPSFYGYEYAAKATGSKIIYYEMNQKNSFALTKEIDHILTEDTDILFLANPNNPTGHLLPQETLKFLLHRCKDKGITVLLDECFIEFAGSQFSMVSQIEEFDNLMIIRAFTKIFSIPGVRLGYLICKNPLILTKIACQLPEWNLSCFAQEAGCACAKETDFIQKTIDYIAMERQFLEQGLLQKGFQIFPSTANFILLYSEEPLYEKLLAKGILIRDCGNFRGLKKGFYRIAVKTRKENEILLESL